MSQLTEIYDSATYNFIPSFHDGTADWFRRWGPSLLEPLWEIFKKHEQYSNYALVLVHKHFQLDNNEILVESKTSDLAFRVAQPWTIKDGKAYSPNQGFWKGCNLRHRSIIAPTAWYFTADGNPVPYEFETSSVLEDNPPTDFVEELGQKLKLKQLSAYIGLHRLGQRHEIEYYEVTHTDARANVMRQVDQAKGHVPEGRTLQTLWYFDQFGRLFGNDACPDCGVSGS